MKTIITIGFLFINIIGFCQLNVIGLDKDSSKFSITLRPLDMFYTSYNQGKAVSGDIGIKFWSNILSISGAIVEEQVLYGKEDKIKEIQLLYGRNYELVDRFVIETHTGFGLLLDHRGKQIVQSRIGFPLVTKLKFKLSNTVLLALRMVAQINSINDMYSAGIRLKWEFS